MEFRFYSLKSYVISFLFVVDTCPLYRVEGQK